MADFITVSEMRQTRSKSKHLLDVAFVADKQSNSYPVLFKLGEFCIQMLIVFFVIGNFIFFFVKHINCIQIFRSVLYKPEL